jgi:predicted dithiol-disulfide oxidoreductase (DUF899 family)
MSTSTIENPKIVSRDEWLVARKKLLIREKQLTHKKDAIAEERRKLPWVKVAKNYVFDSPSGKKTLADLFGGKNQLIVYHFMFGPDWSEGCPSCSFNMDHVDGSLVHLAQRDVSFAAISRAPSSKIEPFKKRMGWKFNWASSYANDFNRDYGVFLTKEESNNGNSYNFGTSDFLAKKLRESVSSTRKGKKSSIPTQRMHEAQRRFSTLTTTSNSCPRGATKKACTSPWRGCATTIGTRTDGWQTQPNLTGRQRRREPRRCGGTILPELQNQAETKYPSR